MSETTVVNKYYCPSDFLDRPYAVYIGRGSKWGNPFKIGSDGERHEVVEKYRRYLWYRIERGEITAEELTELNGKSLVCFCAPKLCHGDVLKLAVEWAVKEVGTPPITR